MTGREATPIFENEVLIKYPIYNGLFITLALGGIDNTGVLLPLLQRESESGYREGKSPHEAIMRFFARNPAYKTEKSRTELLFRFIQYVERQIVLFDSLEDAAYSKTHNLSGPGTLAQLAGKANRTIRQFALQRIATPEKQAEENRAQLEIYRKIVTRSLYGNRNASRNSV